MVSVGYGSGPAFWAALTCVIAQARQVRRTAVRLPPAAGPYTGSIGKGPALRVVGIGDSVIAGAGIRDTARTLTAAVAAEWHRRSGSAVAWAIHGRNGIDSHRAAQALVPKLAPDPADLFVVSIGVNDVTRPSTVRRWRNGLNGLLAALHRHSPKARVALLEIPPMQQFPALPSPLSSVMGARAAAFNAVTCEVLARWPGVRLVDYPDDPDDPPLQPGDFAEDGYHPNAEAVQRMAGRLLGLP